MKKQGTKKTKPAAATHQKTDIPSSTRGGIEQVDVSGLYEQVRAILDDARHRAARSVNVEMVRAYWSSYRRA